MLKLLLWPFFMVWSLLGILLNLLGRLFAALIGLVIMLAGAILTFTVVGAIVGIPLLIAGGALFLRSLL